MEQRAALHWQLGGVGTGARCPVSIRAIQGQRDRPAEGEECLLMSPASSSVWRYEDITAVAMLAEQIRLGQAEVGRCLWSVILRWRQRLCRGVHALRLLASSLCPQTLCLLLCLPCHL